LKSSNNRSASASRVAGVSRRLLRPARFIETIIRAVRGSRWVGM
jgi:hypothetical protein